jgi:hypothetical protein
MNIRKAVAVLALSMMTATAAEAQGSGPEITLGVAAFSRTTTDSPGGDFSSTSFGISSPLLRVAFYLTPKIALEPQFAFSSTSDDNDISSSNLSVFALLPIYLSGEPRSTGLYVAPGFGFERMSQDNGVTDDSQSQTFFGVELGKKFKLTDAVAFRLAGQYLMKAENEDDGIPEQTAINVILGASFSMR